MTTQLWDDQQIAEALTELPDWQRSGGDIVRSATLPSFPAAIEVVRKVAEVAEARNHHPDIDIRWRTLTFRCSTHSAGGLTAQDFELAREIDREIDAALAGS